MNQWDKLSGYFNTHSHHSTIDPGAADNILIAWPSLLKGIQLIQHNGENLRALDYGCGGGSFCKELSNKGYSVIGCDSSLAMIEVAKQNLLTIQFYRCDSENIDQLPGNPFDLITSVMVIQFINNVTEFFANINKTLKPGGVLAFAVFNPAYVTKNHGAGKSFDGFATPDHPQHGFLYLTEDTKIPVFIRSLKEYDNQLIPLGYQRIYSDMPEFTTQYLTQYKTDCDTSSPEFLIMVYQKEGKYAS